MRVLATLVGVVLILAVLLDAFETVVLPRTVMRRVRLSLFFFEITWRLYQFYGRMKPGPRRQALLNSFGPFNLIVLITTWALCCVLAFALVHLGLRTPFHGHEDGFVGLLYFSGVTFFTLGFGDVVPAAGMGRMIAVFEAGMGFAFLALVIGYFPVLYAAFSRREVRMLLLDSKAGSEPMGVELLKRHAEADCLAQLPELLKDWETFAAELLESYLSYPLLAYYRSQHDDSSWLKSLVAVMDACALIEADAVKGHGCDPQMRFQARATLAMGRHLLVDLAYILAVPPQKEKHRMSPEAYNSVRDILLSVGLNLAADDECLQHFRDTRELYEPYALGLAQDLILDLPLWCAHEAHADNWQTSAWEGAKHF